MSVTFAHPILLLIALLLLGAASITALLRRPRVPRRVLVLFLTGLTCLALAAGGPTARLPVTPRVAVMVDLSPSTRTAAYRDRAAFERRVSELLPDVAYDVTGFAGADPWPMRDGHRLPDLPADQTVYAPPPGVDAVVLFTDARFTAPAVAPPTFVVTDPALLDVRDAAVTDLTWRDGQAVATVRNTGQRRDLTWSSPAPPQTNPAPPGTSLHAHRVDAVTTSAASTITARLSPAAAWPENDALSLAPPPPPNLERWWVSRSRRPPTRDWRAVAPGELPLEPTAYLTAAVVVIDNVPATALPAADRLLQYVRDLGGAVVIVGGDGAFAAGGYANSPLDALSPLASSPPTPQRHWLLLTDASGSMAGDDRWSVANTALRDVLAVLPSADLVSVGGFAAGVEWWIEATPVLDALRQPLPPPAAQPRGPTNLGPALRQVAAGPRDASARDLLLLTDAEATLADVERLARTLRDADVRLHVLLTGDGPAAEALRELSRATGGSVVETGAPAEWSRGIVDLARGAMSDHLMRASVDVNLLAGAPPLATTRADLWNRTWLKEGAELLGDAVHEGARIPLLARWRVGAGSVVAAAFGASPADVTALANAVAVPPRDPRFVVSVNTGSSLVITVRARDADAPLNDVPLEVGLGHPTGGQSITPAQQIPQVAPGEYRLTLPHPRQTTILTVLHAGRPLERVAIAGRYAPEFDHVGFDARAAAALAERTGGRVVPVAWTGPLDLPRRSESRSLVAALAVTGAALLAVGLLTWRHT